MEPTHILRIYRGKDHPDMKFGGSYVFPLFVEGVIRQEIHEFGLVYWTRRDDGTEKMHLITSGHWSSIEEVTEAERDAIVADRQERDRQLAKKYPNGRMRQVFENPRAELHGNL